MRSVQIKLIKIGARPVRHARRLVFQLAEVACRERFLGSAGAHRQVMCGTWLREGGHAEQAASAAWGGVVLNDDESCEHRPGKGEVALEDGEMTVDRVPGALVLSSRAIGLRPGLVEMGNRGLRRRVRFRRHPERC